MHALRHMRMLRGHGRLPHFQHLATDRFGLGQLTLAPEQPGELIQCVGDVRIIGGQKPLANLHHPPEHRLGLLILLLILQHRCQQVEAARDVDLVRRIERLVVRQHLAIDRLGLGELVLILQHRGEIAHGDQRLRVAGRAMQPVQFARLAKLRQRFIKLAQRAEGGSHDVSHHRFGDGFGRLRAIVQRVDRLLQRLHDRQIGTERFGRTRVAEDVGQKVGTVFSDLRLLLRFGALPFRFGQRQPGFVAFLADIADVKQ